MILNERLITADQAVSCVESGNRVFIHGSAATPVSLVKALQRRHAEIKDIELVSITNMGDLDFDKPEYRKSFFFNSLFVSANTRSVANSSAGDYVPVFPEPYSATFPPKNHADRCSNDTGVASRYAWILFTWHFC
jgi:acyl-CoA hydrolase